VLVGVNIVPRRNELHYREKQSKVHSDMQISGNAPIPLPIPITRSLASRAERKRLETSSLPPTPKISRAPTILSPRPEFVRLECPSFRGEESFPRVSRILARALLYSAIAQPSFSFPFLVLLRQPNHGDRGLQMHSLIYPFSFRLNSFSG
jgi:hypothetical protein